eukprot:56679_1
MIRSINIFLVCSIFQFTLYFSEATFIGILTEGRFTTTTLNSEVSIKPKVLTDYWRNFYYHQSREGILDTLCDASPESCLLAGHHSAFSDSSITEVTVDVSNSEFSGLPAQAKGICYQLKSLFNLPKKLCRRRQNLFNMANVPAGSSEMWPMKSSDDATNFYLKIPKTGPITFPPFMEKLPVDGSEFLVNRKLLEDSMPECESFETVSLEIDVRNPLMLMDSIKKERGDFIGNLQRRYAESQEAGIPCKDVKGDIKKVNTIEHDVVLTAKVVERRICVRKTQPEGYADELLSRLTTNLHDAVLDLRKTVQPLRPALHMHMTRNLGKAGFHRELTTELTWESETMKQTLDFDHAGTTCSISLIEYFPPSVYVDVYELSENERFGGPSAKPFSEIDVEKPSHISPAHVVRVTVDHIEIVSTSATTVSIPVHLRYAPPSANKTERIVKILPPVVLLKCPYMRHWARVRVHDAGSTLTDDVGAFVTASVPVGQIFHGPLVTWVTLLLTCVAAIVLMTFIWKFNFLQNQKTHVQ